MPTTAPFETTLSTQDFETSGLEFCVSQLMTSSFLPRTPPSPLIFFASSRAAVSAGLSNGAIWPLRSAAKPMTIGFFAAFAPVRRRHPDGRDGDGRDEPDGADDAPPLRTPHAALPSVLLDEVNCVNRARPRSASSRGGSRQSESSKSFPNVPSSEKTSRS